MIKAYLLKIKLSNYHCNDRNDTLNKEMYKRNNPIHPKHISIKKISNSVKDKAVYQTETVLNNIKTNKKIYHKQTSSKMKGFYENTVSNIHNISISKDKDRNFLMTEDRISNFSNYQKLTKTTIKRNNNDLGILRSNNASIITQGPNKKTSLNMSFLNQFVEKHLSLSQTTRKLSFNDSFEKNISTFSLQFPNKKISQTTNSNNTKIESPLVQTKKISRNINEVRESLTNVDENYVKNVLMNSAGKVLSVDLINKIFNEMPEVNNKKSSTSTKEETLKIFNSINIPNKNLEVDTVEYLHFLFVQFFQKSKQITSSQENKKIPQKIIHSDKNMIKFEEVDIE